nr:MAG TPA: adenine-specific methyltransferase [Bacteriophage sp.]
MLVTNTPFSLFRELYELIIQNGKDFILLETL